MIRRDQQQAQRRNRGAFTLMEMLVVVAIIVILAGMGGFFFLGQLQVSRKDAARTQINTLNNAVTTYTIRTKGNYPDNPEQLCQDITLPDGSTSPKILEDVRSLDDPWGKRYEYANHKFHCTPPDGSPKIE